MKKYLIIVAILFIFGCETVVDIDIANNNKTLVLNSFINPDSTIRVEVSETTGILSNVGGIRGIDNAVISLFEADNFIQEMVYDSDKLFYTSQDFKPKINTTYRLELEADGHDKLLSTTQIPVNPPAVTNFKIDSVFEDGAKRLEFELTFNDPQGENFYEIEAYAYYYEREYDQQTNTSTIIDSTLYKLNLISEDQVIEEYLMYDKIMFNDKLFNGKEFTINFNPSIYVGGDLSAQFGTLIIIFKNLNKDYFEYERTSELQDWVDDDPFAEPVPVYNNIENGYGIFGGFSQHSFTVSLKE